MMHAWMGDLAVLHTITVYYIGGLRFAFNSKVGNSVAPMPNLPMKG